MVVRNQSSVSVTYVTHAAHTHKRCTHDAHMIHIDRYKVAHPE